MSKIHKILILTLFSILICFISYRICYFIAEKFFFDKFFYQKSIKYGYVPPNYPTNLLFTFGDRAKDIVGDYNNLRYFPDSQKYKITVIGDSYVWGNGLKNKDRFVNLLETKLNKIRPTKIISMGFPGWNNLDYYRVYQDIIKVISPDLTIVAIYKNDIFVSEKDNSNPILLSCIKKNHLNPEYFNFYSYLDFNNTPGEKEDQLETTLKKAWSNSVNLCTFRQSFSLLPNKNALYFKLTDYSGENIFYQKIQNELDSLHKTTITTKIGIQIPEKYFPYFLNTRKNFSISNKEEHSNALANQMYADILYNEITTNPQWGFTK